MAPIPSRLFGDFGFAVAVSDAEAKLEKRLSHGSAAAPSKVRRENEAVDMMRSFPPNAAVRVAPARNGSKVLSRIDATFRALIKAGSWYVRPRQADSKETSVNRSGIKKPS